MFPVYTLRTEGLIVHRIVCGNQQHATAAVHRYEVENDFSNNKYYPHSSAILSYITLYVYYTNRTHMNVSIVSEPSSSLIVMYDHINMDICLCVWTLILMAPIHCRGSIVE